MKRCMFFFVLLMINLASSMEDPNFGKPAPRRQPQGQAQQVFPTLAEFAGSTDLARQTSGSRHIDSIIKELVGKFANQLEDKLESSVSDISQKDAPAELVERFGQLVNTIEEKIKNYKQRVKDYHLREAIVRKNLQNFAGGLLRPVISILQKLIERYPSPSSVEDSKIESITKALTTGVGYIRGHYSSTQYASEETRIELERPLQDLIKLIFSKRILPLGEIIKKGIDAQRDHFIGELSAVKSLDEAILKLGEYYNDSRIIVIKYTENLGQDAQMQVARKWLDYIMKQQIIYNLIPKILHLRSKLTSPCTLGFLQFPQRSDSESEGLSSDDDTILKRKFYTFFDQMNKFVNSYQGNDRDTIEKQVKEFVELLKSIGRGHDPESMELPTLEELLKELEND